jgi:hypothetical protein
MEMSKISIRVVTSCLGNIYGPLLIRDTHSLIKIPNQSLACGLKKKGAFRGSAVHRPQIVQKYTVYIIVSSENMGPPSHTGSELGCFGDLEIAVLFTLSMLGDSEHTEVPAHLIKKKPRKDGALHRLINYIDTKAKCRLMLVF